MTTDIRPWNSIATTYFLAYMRRREAWDTFSHDETNSFGSLETSTDTQAWTSTGGSASDYQVADGIASHLMTNGTLRLSYTTDFSLADGSYSASMRVDQAAAGGSIVGGIAGRVVDVDNYYMVELMFETDQTMTLRIRQRVSGSLSTLVSTTTDLTHSITKWYGLTLQITGTTLRARAWDTSEDEPTTWDVERYQAFDLITGGMALRSFISAGNSNTNPTVEYAEVTAYTLPDWQNITEWVSIAQALGAEVEGWIGRQTELSDIEPARLTFAMKNQNGWFTPDNTSSPYWPDWTGGVPIRWFETIGAKTFQPVPDMFAEVLEVSASTWSTTDEESSDRMLQVSCTDRLTQLNNAPAFVSNLAAYIVANAAAADLVAYWPLNDPSGSGTAGAVASAGATTKSLRQIGDTHAWVGASTAYVVFAEVTGPPGDDSTYVQFNLAPDDVTSSFLPVFLEQEGIDEITVAGTGLLSVTFWNYIPESGLSAASGVTVGNKTSAHYIHIADDDDGDWRLNVESSPGALFSGGSVVRYARWQMVTASLDCASGDVTLWVDDEDEVAAGSVGNSTSAAFSRVFIHSAPGGALAHMQVRIGTAFTHAEHLAQYDVGFNGLGQQTVDQRIRTILNYAGISDSQLDLEESDSLIQAPAFAGQRPGVLATTAAVTGGGILFTQADRLVYHDRKHRFAQ